jgi:2-polyprenyl-6-methoxyphenol hydroxylase-like FAD-dependent oxidoreductase
MSNRPKNKFAACVSMWQQDIGHSRGAFMTSAHHTIECSTAVAIIGGGPAGSCCALALRQCGIEHVTIVEASGLDQFRIGETLSPESRQLLNKLGIWREFLAEGHQPCYGSCSWWGDQRRGYNDSLLNPLGHGWHLDRVKFNMFLARQAQKAQAGLLVHHRFQRAIPAPHGGFRLELRHGDRPVRLSADFVIDASGTKAQFAKSQGGVRQFSSPLICSSRAYHILDDGHPLTGLTHLEAVASGWWYAARLPHNKLILSHTTDSETFRKLDLKSTRHWDQELSRAANTRGLIERARPLTHEPEIHGAPSFVLDRMFGDDWLAIGDAASSYDPITSQGLLKSMSDGIVAAQCVAGYLRERDIGLLKEFQSMVRERHRCYRQVRDYFYLQETRFTDQTFWKKMHGLRESTRYESMLEP